MADHHRPGGFREHVGQAFGEAVQYGEENKRLRAALTPFADAVYNDNGDMTVTPCKFDDYVKAYFVMRDLKE